MHGALIYASCEEDYMRDKGGEDEFLTASWFEAFTYCVQFFASDEMSNCSWVSMLSAKQAIFQSHFDFCDLPSASSDHNVAVHHHASVTATSATMAAKPVCLLSCEQETTTSTSSNGPERLIDPGHHLLCFYLKG